MIISEESWIRRFPTVLDPAQGYFLDGVRLAVQTAELAFARLQSTLEALACGKVDNTERLIVSAVQDAWYIIDAVDRVRSLVKNAPKMGPDKPDEVLGFLDATGNVRELRNYLQHLDGRLSQLVSNREPAWGRISWTTWIGEDPVEEGYVCSLIGGTVHPVEKGKFRVRGEIPQSTGDQPIFLEAGDNRVRLDELIGELENLVVWLEGVLDKHFGHLAGEIPKTKPDLLVVLTLDVDEFKRMVGESHVENDGD